MKHLAAVSMLAGLLFGGPALAQSQPLYYGTLTTERLAICGIDVPLDRPSASALIGEACRRSTPTRQRPESGNVVFRPPNPARPSDPVIMAAPGWTPLPRPRIPVGTIRTRGELDTNIERVNNAFRMNPTIQAPRAMGRPR